ncbi:MAG TPA: YfiR family protein [Candidatus Krumholzibacteria bacterium]|nr:YfiR family protein [Candidatus Krumholzibacteria bacterium]
MGRRAVLSLVMLLSAAAHAVAADAPAEARIKAAIVCNLARVVSWPAADRGIAFRLDVAGDPDGEGPDFSSLAGKEIHGRPLTVRAYDAADVGELVFILGSDAAICDAILAGAEGRPVLTVSEIGDFCARGGMVQLVRRRGRLSMVVNREAAAAAGLQLSSQLLKVAELYGEER